MQRCCFFGQHSHTLHSLLGLSDVKLKNELSALVDTSIWVNTLQDVKGREKKEKLRVTELSVEIRVREEEAARSQAAIDADTIALSILKNEVEDAKLKGDRSLDFFYPESSHLHISIFPFCSYLFWHYLRLMILYIWRFAIIIHRMTSSINTPSTILLLPLLPFLNEVYFFIYTQLTSFFLINHNFHIFVI